jgi:hypothetical protein
MKETHLLEPDLVRVLAEALAAEVEVVLADETGNVGAEAAESIQSPLATMSVGQGKDCSPLARALAVLAGTREPDGVVSHFDDGGGAGVEHARQGETDVSKSSNSGNRD